MTLNGKGIKLPDKPISKQKKEIIVPGYLKDALAGNDKAAATFNKFCYSHKKNMFNRLPEQKRVITGADEWERQLEY